MIAGQLWKWLAAVLGSVAAVLLALLKVTQAQRDSARGKAQAQADRADTAEARITQRQRAETASQQAKEEGDARVEAAVGRARDGLRDHFE